MYSQVSALAHMGLHDAMMHVIRVGIGLIGQNDEPQMPPRPDPPAFVPGT